MRAITQFPRFGPRLVTLLAALTAAALIPAAAAFGEVGVRPGAVGIGDPYFPKDGNGGYDVDDYDLALRYEPATGRLEGLATITAVATHGLTQFNLDLSDLTVRSIAVNGLAARWQHDDTELTVKPQVPVVAGTHMAVVVRYDGMPGMIKDKALGSGGFVRTSSGAVVAGQPHVATTWFPVNDHPLDTASVTTRIQVPAGLTAVSNGVLQAKETEGGWTTWTWRAEDPMASYLLTASIGKIDLRSYERDGIRYWDAVDHSLAAAFRPRTGKRFAIVDGGDTTYQRLTRTVAVPKRGAKLSFSVRRTSEPKWDFFFVEARTAGRQDWTTLRDQQGHSSRDTGSSCPYWFTLHPSSSTTSRKRRKAATRRAPAAHGGPRVGSVTATSGGPSTCLAMPGARSRSRSPTPTTTCSRSRAPWSTTSSAPRARERPRSNATGTRWTGGP